jgi:hypothetical protein
MKLYLGDTSDNFASWVLDQDPSAMLGTNDNLRLILSNNNNVYTSLMDVSRANIIELCLAADQIILYNDKWEDTDLERETKIFIDRVFGNTENEFYNHLNTALILNDIRKTEKPQLWAVGCSYTSSVGVGDDQRWAVKLADKIQRPVSILAYPGASITWAADQILRSDIKSGDTVAWLLTTMHRIDYYSESDHTVKIHPNLSVYAEDKDEILKLSDSEHKLLMRSLALKWHVYLSFKAIRQVINHCEKLNAKLILGQCLQNDIDTNSALLSLLKFHPGFVLKFSAQLYYDTFMLDLGTDNLHPGPITHEYIAEEFYKHLCSLK